MALHLKRLFSSWQPEQANHSTWKTSTKHILYVNSFNLFYSREIMINQSINLNASTITHRKRKDNISRNKRTCLNFILSNLYQLPFLIRSCRFDHAQTAHSTPKLKFTLPSHLINLYFCHRYVCPKSIM